MLKLNGETKYVTDGETSSHNQKGFSPRNLRRQSTMNHINEKLNNNISSSVVNLMDFPCKLAYEKRGGGRSDYSLDSHYSSSSISTSKTNSLKENGRLSDRLPGINRTKERLSLKKSSSSSSLTHVASKLSTKKRSSSSSSLSSPSSSSSFSSFLTISSAMTNIGAVRNYGAVPGPFELVKKTSQNSEKSDRKKKEREIRIKSCCSDRSIYEHSLSPIVSDQKTRQNVYSAELDDDCTIQNETVIDDEMGKATLLEETFYATIELSPRTMITSPHLPSRVVDDDDVYDDYDDEDHHYILRKNQSFINDNVKDWSPMSWLQLDDEEDDEDNWRCFV